MEAIGQLKRKEICTYALLLLSPNDSTASAFSNAPPDVHRLGQPVNRQTLAAVLAAERLYVEVTSTYATKLIENIALGPWPHGRSSKI